jgi:hypothetical protein
VAHFTWLTKKDQTFSWGIEGDNAFQSLKTSFTTTLLFIHVNLSIPFVLEVNTFNFTIGVMFSQLGEENFLHHINFHFCKFYLT